VVPACAAIDRSASRAASKNESAPLRMLGRCMVGEKKSRDGDEWQAMVSLRTAMLLLLQG